MCYLSRHLVRKTRSLVPTGTVKSCMVLSHFPLLFPFPSSLRFRLGFRFTMLCLFHLQLSVFILSFRITRSLQLCTAGSSSCLLPIHSLFLISDSPSRYFPCADSDHLSSHSRLPWIGFPSVTCASFSLLFRLTRLPHLLAPFGFVSREVPG